MLVVGPALRFALNAPPCGLRRAALRAKPTSQKRQGCIGRPRSGASFLGLAREKFSRETAKRSTKRYKTKKGDTSIEVRKGTFLKSFDILRRTLLTWPGDELRM